MESELEIGQIVKYVLTHHNAVQINKRRADAVAARAFRPQDGAIIHIGNEVLAGDVVPLIITRIWDQNLINGQVILDGNDTFWVTSVARFNASWHDSEQGHFLLK